MNLHSLSFQMTYLPEQLVEICKEKIIYLSTRRPRESLETLRMSPRDSVPIIIVANHSRKDLSQ